MFACIHAPDFGGSLVDFAYNFSPLVEEVDSDCVVLGIAGCDLLFGDPGAVAKKIASAALEIGCKANVAAARNPDAAIHAARGLPGITVVSPGEEAEYLGGLPLESLCPKLAGVDDDQARAITETAALWGLKCFRDLAELPEAGIAERLGPDGLRLQRLARGSSTRPLIIKETAPGFEKSLDLDDPVALIEPLSFILARLLNQLCGSLQLHALATSELRVRLKLEDTTEIDRMLRLPFPTLDHKLLLKLLVLEIEADPPQAAVVAVSIKAEPAKPRTTQNGLFQAASPEPEKLELTIARISKLVGVDNVGSPEVLNTHRPGAFRMRRFRVFRNALAKSRGRLKQKQTPATSATRLKRKQGFRVFRPPLRADVYAPSGCPTRITAKSAEGISRSIDGKVARMAGPWRTTGDWWAEDAWARDEWDVAVGNSGAEQGLFRIYHELRTDHWFVEGMYD